MVRRASLHSSLGPAAIAALAERPAAAVDEQPQTADATPTAPEATDQEQPRTLPDELLSARVVVISDFNCPYCFTLNEWLADLGLSSDVRWVGIEHKPHLPQSFAALNLEDDRSTLVKEVSDVVRRAPDLGVRQPPVWINSRQALQVQAAIEDDRPELAAALRQRIFRDFWQNSRNIADPSVLDQALADLGLPAADQWFLDEHRLDGLSRWWRQDLDRIPCMLAPTGARHLGLQDRRAVEAFVLGALREPPPAAGCR